MPLRPDGEETTPSLLLSTTLTELSTSDLCMPASLRTFVGQLAEDPEQTLRLRRRRTLKLCQPYFDLCEANALECDRRALRNPELVLDPAHVAVRLAEASGDKHRVNRSLGVLAHAHLAVEQPVAALAVLESYRRQALYCCRSCKADWLHRHGDYLVETRDGTRAARTLSRCLRVTEGPDHAGRVGFVHGISHHFLGRRDAALEAELRVLETLDLRSPRGYFLDTVAMLAVFLRGASPEHDRYVLRRLERFRTRMQGVRDWTVVRVCLRWVEGQLLARLGDFDSAIQRLDGVRSFLLKNGPLRQAVAVNLDLSQIYCRHGYEYGENYRTVETMLNACKRQIPAEATGEEAMLCAGLDRVINVLGKKTEEAFDALVELRSSFVVPVPGIVAERLGGGAGLVLVG